MPFLSISGLPVAVTEIRESPRRLVGERARAFAGNLRSTVRRSLRSWTVTTAPLDSAAETQLRSFSGKTILLTVWGDFIGEPASCLMRVIGSTYIKDGDTGALKQLELLIEEVGTGVIPVPDPARTVATIPNVQVGQTRAMIIQVYDNSGAPASVGGAAVAVTITGANASSPFVADNDDGSYTVVDVPAAVGVDQVAITLNGIPIGGSPYTALVSAVVGAVASLTVTPGSLGLLVGGSAQLTAVPKDASNQPVTGRVVTWETQSSAIAVPGSVGYVVNALGIGAGSTQIRANVETTPGSGVFIHSNWVTVTVTGVPVVTGLPSLANLGPAPTLLLDWSPTRIPSPVNTVMDGIRIYSGGDYGRISLRADAGSPSGKSLYIWLPPSFQGGGGPEHISWDYPVGAHGNNRWRQVFLAFLMRYSPGFIPNGNVGVKHGFPQNASRSNAPYLNGWSSSGRSGANIESSGLPASLNQSAFTWLSKMDGALHLWENILRQQSGQGIHDGSWEDYLDGVFDKLVTGMQRLLDSENPLLFGDDGFQLTHTYGGGVCSPPGVVGVGGVGSFRRTDGVTGTSVAGQFTRTSGSFSTTGKDRVFWVFVNPATGAFSAPIHVTVNTAATLDNAAIPAGCTVAYPTFEPFDASVIGKTITMRSGALDYNYGFSGGVQIGGTGVYPLILGPKVITGRTTTTQPFDTITWSSGGDATGSAMCLGLDAFGLTEPIHIVIGRIACYGIA